MSRTENADCQQNDVVSLCEEDRDMRYRCRRQLRNTFEKLCYFKLVRQKWSVPVLQRTDENKKKGIELYREETRYLRDLKFMRYRGIETTLTELNASTSLQPQNSHLKHVKAKFFVSSVGFNYQKLLEYDLKNERENKAWHDNTVRNDGSAHRKNRINKYAFAGAVLASTNSILLGYDIGVMSGAVLYIKDNFKITSGQVEILVGCLNVCSLIGSLASGRTSDYIGRRHTIVLAAATFLIGALLMGLAPSFIFLMAGRVVAGIGVGYSLMIAPVYAAEISPAMTRGFLSSLPEVFINVGILLGYVSNYALSGLPENKNWRLMLGLSALPAIIVALGVLVMPESPRWLVMKGRFGDALEVLIKTSESREEAGLRLSEMIKAAKDLTHGATSSNWQGQGAWRELLFEPSRPIRRILIAAIGVNFFMQASGNDAVVYYSPQVFKDAGIQNRQQLVGVTIIMGIAKTSFALISAIFLDRFGRRPALLLGSIGMAFSLASLGLGSKFLEHSNSKPVWAITLCVIAVCADVSFFSIGLGPVTWVYSSEIFPIRLRAQGSSLAISVNRLVSGIVAMTFLSISEVISFGGMFLVLSLIMVVGAIFFYFFLPETKGRTLEEIGVLFEDERDFVR